MQLTGAPHPVLIHLPEAATLARHLKLSCRRDFTKWRRELGDSDANEESIATESVGA